MIFNHEMQWSQNGQTRRVSIQVPAESMSPRTAGLLVELHDLNRFFKDGLDDLNDTVALIDQEKEKLKLPVAPTLFLSDSHHQIPLASDSSNLLAQSPLEQIADNGLLAARRGKLVAPLQLGCVREKSNDSYPGIPSAFLGSPSTYSPIFQDVGIGDGTQPTDVNDMIRSLRAQCDNIAETNTRVSQAIVQEPQQAFQLKVHEVGSGRHKKEPHTPVSLEDRSRHEIAANVRSSTHEASKRSSSQPRPPSTGPPGVPLPPLPKPRPSGPPQRAMSLEPAKTSYAVQGILKTSKSVRFASLPNRHRHASAPSIDDYMPRSAPPYMTSARSRPASMQQDSQPTPASMPRRAPSPAVGIWAGPDPHGPKSPIKANYMSPKKNGPPPMIPRGPHPPVLQSSRPSSPVFTRRPMSPGIVPRVGSSTAPRRPMSPAAAPSAAGTRGPVPPPLVPRCTSPSGIPRAMSPTQRIPSGPRQRGQTLSSNPTSDPSRTAERRNTMGGPRIPLVNVPVIHAQPQAHSQAPARPSPLSNGSGSSSSGGSQSSRGIGTRSGGSGKGPSPLHGRKYSTVDENALRRQRGGGSLKSKVPVPLQNILMRFK